MNIISNAIDSIESKGIIEIKIEINEKTSNLIIAIKDSGVGIQKKVLDKIFDPFYTTKEVGKGTGLGLYIAYGIIQQHNGNMDVTSQPNKGSEFKISLPINN